MNPQQITKITRNGRISLGKIMEAMNLQEGDYVQLFITEEGKTCLSKVKMEA